MAQPFWKRKSLVEMTANEWESLCDGCAKCCLIKLQDDETEEIFYTDVVCHLLNTQACRCTDYPNRSKRVPDCVVLTPKNIDALKWMPETCAYKLVAAGQDLPDWHPLVSGDPASVHKAGISVRDKVVPEQGITDDELEHRIVDWADG